MNVYLDGDSCPRPVREFVAKSCRRSSVPLVCVANRAIPFEDSEGVQMLVVEVQEGAADEVLVEKAQPGDLVITRDIPLAARLVENEVTVINDRGTVYSRENVRERLSVRNFMADLRAFGLPADTSGTWGKKEWEAFVRSWDKEFHRLLKLASQKFPTQENQKLVQDDI